MSSSESDVRRTLLDTLLRQSDIRGKAFSEALLTHGPILTEEVPYLAKTAAEGNADARRNAVYLLCRVRAPEAEVALRKIAAETSQAQVLALALDALSFAPDIKTLAVQRQALLLQALQDPSGLIQAAALRVGWRLGLPGFADALGQRLDSQNQEVRDAVTGLLSKEGAGPLEARVRQILVHPPADKRYSFADLYQSIGNSDDPTVADDLRRSLEGADSSRETDLLNGFFLSQSRKPWLKQFLLSLARQESRIRWPAFESLVGWKTDAPEPDLLRICIAALERRPPQESTEESVYDIELESCRSYLGALAGRRFGWQDFREALAFARQRLASHSE